MEERKRDENYRPVKTVLEKILISIRNRKLKQKSRNGRSFRKSKSGVTSGIITCGRPLALR